MVKQTNSEKQNKEVGHGRQRDPFDRVRHPVCHRLLPVRSRHLEDASPAVRTSGQDRAVQGLVAHLGVPRYDHVRGDAHEAHRERPDRGCGWRIMDRHRARHEVRQVRLDEARQVLSRRCVSRHRARIHVQESRARDADEQCDGHHRLPSHIRVRV